MNAIMTRAEREDLQAARPPARKSAETSNQTTIGGLERDDFGQNRFGIPESARV
jgi:hypothetical protein